MTVCETTICLWMRMSDSWQPSLIQMSHHFFVTQVTTEYILPCCHKATSIKTKCDGLLSVIMMYSLLQKVTHILVVLYAGGKSSGIFGESEPAARTQKPAPPGGSTSNIFGAAESASVHSPSRSHPNKPKVGWDLIFNLFNLLYFPHWLLNTAAGSLLN